MKPEMLLQIEFARWLDKQSVLYCASAGGMRVNMITAVNMKRAGYKKGFPDIAIFQAAGGYHGLFIELKAGKNIHITPEQKAWQEALTKEGYCALIMPGKLDFPEALQWLKNAVNGYLRASKTLSEVRR